MNYLIMLGSDMFYGTNGVMTVQIGNKMVEFFRIREIFKERSEGSYLAVDCDIKDKDNIREIKLAKSNPVAKGSDINVQCDKRETTVTRNDGSLVIKVEQVDLGGIPLVEFEPVKKTINGMLSGWPEDRRPDINQILGGHEISAVIKITGNFYAGDFHLEINEEKSKIGGINTSGNLMVDARGMRLTQGGFSLG